LKHAELKQREEKLAAACAEKESAKRYDDAMKAYVKPMGPEMLDVVLFFRHITAIFQRFAVPVNDNLLFTSIRITGNIEKKKNKS